MTIQKKTKRKKSQKLLSISGIFVFILFLATVLLFPVRHAFADPHAVFFTDRAQEQLFFNVLAALNQADYVEFPQEPLLQDVRRMGDYLAGRTPPSPKPSPSIQRDADGNVISRDPPLIGENDQERIELPRIRVRQVTSDDGDVYYREFLERRATVELQRTELTKLICGFRALYWGKTHAEDCLEQIREQGFNLLDPPQ